jgi:hypothetical protein
VEYETLFYEYDPFVGKNLVIKYGPGEEMPGTAVVRIYNGEGFVVAADGLRRDGTGKEITASQQKIFKIEDADKRFAYAATGVTYIDQGADAFDVSAEVIRVANALLAKNYDSALRYTEQFGKTLKRSLHQGQKDQRIREFLDFGKGELIVSVLFAGYYTRRPFMSRVALFHQKQDVQPPKIEFEDLVPSDIRVEISGSAKVRGLLLEGVDPRLAAYRSDSWEKVRNKQPISLADSLELAKTYIAACADPEAREVDPECAAIGGQIHVATITSTEGFKWVVEPRTTNYSTKSFSS